MVHARSFSYPMQMPSQCSKQMLWGRTWGYSHIMSAARGGGWVKPKDDTMWIGRISILMCGSICCQLYISNANVSLFNIFICFKHTCQYMLGHMFSVFQSMKTQWALKKLPDNEKLYYMLCFWWFTSIITGLVIKYHVHHHDFEIVHYWSHRFWLTFSERPSHWPPPTVSH